MCSLWTCEFLMNIGSKLPKPDLELTPTSFPGTPPQTPLYTLTRTTAVIAMEQMHQRMPSRLDAAAPATKSGKHMPQNNGPLVSEPMSSSVNGKATERNSRPSAARVAELRVSFE